MNNTAIDLLTKERIRLIEVRKAINPHDSKVMDRMSEDILVLNYSINELLKLRGKDNDIKILIKAIKFNEVDSHCDIFKEGCFGKSPLEYINFNNSLLKKYMKHVNEEEGVMFIPIKRETPRVGAPVFTDEEIDVLSTLSNEIYEEEERPIISAANELDNHYTVFIKKEGKKPNLIVVNDTFYKRLNKELRVDKLENLISKYRNIPIVVNNNAVNFDVLVAYFSDEQFNELVKKYKIIL